MKETEISDHLIEMYRELVKDRYQYDYLASHYSLPSFLTEEKVGEIRDYFLHYVYPDAATRIKLNKAFESLDGHIKDTSHLLRLMMDATGLLFKYGRHLPRIFRTGIKALQSFRKVARFESLLLAAARDSNLSLPVSKDTMKRLIAQLPLAEVRDFIDGNDSLFDALMDKKLMQKTIDLMGRLIKKMKKHPQVYRIADIEGIEVGRKILEGGTKIVNGLKPSEGRAILNLIKQIESDAIDTIYNQYA